MAPPLPPPPPPRPRKKARIDDKISKHTVIIGGGVIGCATAYYLTRHPKFDPQWSRVTVLEACRVAAGSSGSAGGLLGRWAYPQPLVNLSYREHASLAREHGGASRWGYRKVECGMVEVEARKARPAWCELGSNSVKSVTVREPVQEGQHAQRDQPQPQPQQKQQQQPQKQQKQQQQPATRESSPRRSLRTKERRQSSDQATSAEPTRWKRTPKEDAAAIRLLAKSVLPPDLDYIDPEHVTQYRRRRAATAQVHPHEFTTALAALAVAAGAEVRTGALVTRILSGDGGVTAIEYVDHETRETVVIDDMTELVVAAGPWTATLLPAAQIEAIRIHSVIWNADVSPHAIFTRITLPPDFIPTHRTRGLRRRKWGMTGTVDPEMYPRPNGEVYACGQIDETVPLPATADDVLCDEYQCEDLISFIGLISKVLTPAKVIARQACYIPRHRLGPPEPAVQAAGPEEKGEGKNKTGKIKVEEKQQQIGTEELEEEGEEGEPADEPKPLIGPTSVRGLFVASGHSCWGIQNAPGTGLLMSELIMDGVVKSIRPDEFGVFDPRKYGL